MDDSTILVRINENTRATIALREYSHKMDDTELLKDTHFMARDIITSFELIMTDGPYDLEIDGIEGFCILISPSNTNKVAFRAGYYLNDEIMCSILSIYINNDKSAKDIIGKIIHTIHVEKNDSESV